MRKGFLLIVFAWGLLFSLSAQRYQEVFFYNDVVSKNFFLGFGFKGNVYVNNNSANDVEVWKKPTLGINVFTGYWFSQIFGGRLLFEGGRIHPYFQNTTRMVEESYALGRLDLLIDMTSSIYGYSRDKIYSFIPYAGFSGAYVYNAENRPDNAVRSSSFFFGVGIMNSFRMSQNLSTYINFGFDFVDANFDGYKDNRKLNGIASASIGLVVDF